MTRIENHMTRTEYRVSQIIDNPANVANVTTAELIIAVAICHPHADCYELDLLSDHELRTLITDAHDNF